MRTYTHGLLIVIFSGLMLGGCANKEAVKAEEPVAAPVATVSEAPPPAPVPAPVPPSQPPPQPKIEVVPAEPIKIPEPPPKTVFSEAVQNVTLETIHFEFDKYDLRKSDRDILTNTASVLQNKLKGNVKIEGHCDERGSAEYNLALGERRARSAMNYLVTLGVPAERLSIISYGKEKPIDPGHDEDAWAKNRRAEFAIMTV